MLETSDFVHGSAIWSFSLVMSECSLSGRGQNHASNFYIVDLENFLKNTKSQYVSNGLTDLQDIWHGDAEWES